MIVPSAGLAFSALLRNKMRSSLTMLGMIIGVGAVVMMQSMGGGATQYVSETITGLGSNMLFAIPGTARGFGQMTTGVPLFTLGDLDAIRRQAHDIALVTAGGSRAERVVFGGRNRSSAVGGVMPEYFEIRSWGVTSGRLYTQEDERQGASVCLVGTTVVGDIFQSQSPLGKDLRVRDKTCRVIGVLESKGAAVGADQDDVVFMPYSTFSRRLVGNDRTAAIMASNQQILTTVQKTLTAVTGNRSTSALSSIASGGSPSASASYWLRSRRRIAAAPSRRASS